MILTWWIVWYNFKQKLVCNCLAVYSCWMFRNITLEICNFEILKQILSFQNWLNYSGLKYMEPVLFFLLCHFCHPKGTSPGVLVIYVVILAKHSQNCEVKRKVVRRLKNIFFSPPYPLAINVYLLFTVTAALSCFLCWFQISSWTYALHANIPIITDGNMPRQEQLMDKASIWLTNRAQQFSYLTCV